MSMAEGAELPFDSGGGGASGGALSPSTVKCIPPLHMSAVPLAEITSPNPAGETTGLSAKGAERSLRLGRVLVPRLLALPGALPRVPAAHPSTPAVGWRSRSRANGSRCTAQWRSSPRGRPVHSTFQRSTRPLSTRHGSEQPERSFLFRSERRKGMCFAQVSAHPRLREFGKHILISAPWRGRRPGS